MKYALLLLKLINQIFMKKKIIIVSFASIVAGIVTGIVCQSTELLKNDVEALSTCEITKKDRVIFLCARDENTCEVTYLGYTLTCSGDKCEVE